MSAGASLGCFIALHWRMPTKGELSVLFQNRDAIGGFNQTGLSPCGWYWSSSQGKLHGAWGQCFSDGIQPRKCKAALSGIAFSTFPVIGL